ncbi:MAG: hypothetical protein KGH71_05250 [Candidatus Micrarchaeota archaeon]|nr:hypothetical protein [Candidatus Micrarchaeota archaeon]
MDDEIGHEKDMTVVAPELRAIFVLVVDAGAVVLAVHAVLVMVIVPVPICPKLTASPPVVLSVGFLHKNPADVKHDGDIKPDDVPNIPN